ncbi:MAG: CYTH domain-containing protein [Oryzihumus sp.]
MVEHTLTIQRTYAVDRSTPPPPLDVLTCLPGVVGVESPEPSVLEVTYYDTPGLTLAAKGITLRRTVDGPDPGWTLELPSGEPVGPELTAPLGADDEQVPVELFRPVRVHVRLERVVPAIHLRTERRAHRLIGADHAVLATLADDLVTARPLVRGPRRSSWREWDVELG